MKAKTTILYNVDGVDFSSQTYQLAFTEAELKKLYRKFSVKSLSKTTVPWLTNRHTFINKTIEIAPQVVQIQSYYFVENEQKTITIIQFNYFDHRIEYLEKEMVQRIITNQIDKKVFESRIVSNIDFAGRKLELGRACHWMHANNIQCPYYGQMNWSVHSNNESAKRSIQNQYLVTKSKGVKILHEEEVDVVFEEIQTKAKKIIYDPSGLQSFFAGLTGAKTLTIYYVVAEVRGNFVSCCMSFWNNDEVYESGLPPLIDLVMQLPQKTD